MLLYCEGEAMKSPMIIFGAMLMVMGLIFAAVGTGVGWQGIYDKKDFEENGIPVTALVHDLQEYTRKTSRGTTSGTYVFVIFTTENGDERITQLDQGSSSMRIGQKIDIKYHRYNPSKVYTEGSIKTNIAVFAVFGGLGFAMLAGSIAIIVVQIKKIKMQKRVRTTGRMIRANITGIVDDLSIRVNGVHPRRLEAEFNGTIYHSNHLSNKEIAGIRMNGTVNVYVDRENAKLYFIDLETAR